MRYDRIYISIGCAVHLFLPLHKCGNRRRILQTVNILQKFGFLIIQAVSLRPLFCFQPLKTPDFDGKESGLTGKCI